MDFLSAYTPSNLLYLWEGFQVTLLLALIAIICSYVVGIVLGILRYAKIPVFSRVLGAAVDIIRCLPLLLILFFTHFVLLPELGFQVSPFVAAIVALTVFEGAMISEIIRSGLNSIPKGQIEAARSSGLTYTQTLRAILIPQAARKMMPPTVSQFIALLKDTSLAVIITLPEVMHHARILSAHNSNSVFAILFFVAIMYFVVNFALSKIAKKLEAKHV
ncbi:MAG: Amino acid ABC transporter permease [Shouchella clausii]|jgi:aspartate/glutamate/glutamine transport system permease protein